jgi:hypothetical protein
MRYVLSLASATVGRTDKGLELRDNHWASRGVRFVISTVHPDTIEAARPSSDTAACVPKEIDMDGSFGAMLSWRLNVSGHVYPDLKTSNSHS